jgi:hypothetical protein
METRSTTAPAIDDEAISADMPTPHNEGVKFWEVRFLFPHGPVLALKSRTTPVN